MVLRGTHFGPIFNASGARGFFGEGYAFHGIWTMLGLTFGGVTFVAKTTTLNRRSGNMPLGIDGITPYEKLPRCIIVKPFKGVVLNSVGLSGPGASDLLEDGRWQQRVKPFLISFMSVQSDAKSRLDELKNFIELLFRYRNRFSTSYGLELNFSCPNTGLHLEELVEEVASALTLANHLSIPLVTKFNALITPEAANEIASHPACDALHISNTIPWGQLPERINWKELFGSEVSPLLRRNPDFGGGGLSGKPLLPIVEQWLYKAQDQRIKKPVIAGGGVLGPNDARRLLQAGASGISLGSIGILRPWRMARTIQAINDYLDWDKE